MARDADVRRIAAALDGVVEVDSEGFDFRVAGKGFVWSYPERRPGRPRVIRTDVAVLYVSTYWWTRAGGDRFRLQGPPCLRPWTRRWRARQSPEDAARKIECFLTNRPDLPATERSTSDTD